MFLNAQDFLREIESDKWIYDFAFVVEIMQKLNDSNTRLQSKCVFAYELYLKVKVFQWKLGLFAKQLNEQNYVQTRSDTQNLSDK